ncbi:MAG: hypothetical protein JW837_17595 [Sedimentisphaerales bacterium]|nr:hypothetical protein [Sedimentisphaerales bacterium]
MRHNARNISQSGNRIFSHLAAEKKKAILALSLIVLMVVMWIKVLTKASPKTADAELIAELIEKQNQYEPEIEVSFIELPQIKGRNDLITRDFFDSNGWQTFINGYGRRSAGVEDINIVSRDNDQEVIKRVAENLKLEAIVTSKDPLASINDRVVRIGDKLLVSDGIDTHECEVVEIGENTVVIKCRESQITLKMTQIN